jgi:hypothetical protein
MPSSGADSKRRTTGFYESSGPNLFTLRSSTLPDKFQVEPSHVSIDEITGEAVPLYIAEVTCPAEI